MYMSANGEIVSAQPTQMHFSSYTHDGNDYDEHAACTKKSAYTHTRHFVSPHVLRNALITWANIYIQTFSHGTYMHSKNTYT